MHGLLQATPTSQGMVEGRVSFCERPAGRSGHTGLLFVAQILLV